MAKAILLQGKETLDLAYAYDFYCNGNCNSYLFAIFIVQFDGIGLIAKYDIPQVVWSGKRHNLVRIGVTLELMSKGDLVLKDADGTVAWSTNTFAKSVVDLNLIDLGNLMLFDKDNATIWQSFDHPIDSLVLRKKLRQGQRLMLSVSETNWTVDSMIKLSVNGNGLFAQVETNPPQRYVKSNGPSWNASIEFLYVEFVNGSLSRFSNSTSSWSLISIPQASSAQYMKLGSNGHLTMYDWLYGFKEDLFKKYLNDCDYPTVCGQYEICSNGQCSCPTSSWGMSYFQRVDDSRPNLGCSKNVPLSCGASQQQSLLELENVTYFSFTPNLEDIDASSCKEAYAKNVHAKQLHFSMNRIALAAVVTYQLMCFHL
ncbi:EP1-like glycoprotein 2 [Eucalyptus grandis]|uniref:EP1-like glycoprotein 2 n=1 Tax=Eucalyptus grandis TaxID=71139 RepID=UPI00192E90FC|nr:EP1-like glycoprotein 2 [Eucalyptus grandis]